MSSFGIQPETGSQIPPLNDEEMQVYEQELSAISEMSVQDIAERIRVYEKAQRQLFIKVNTSKKTLHKKLAEMSYEEQEAMGMKGVFIPNKKANPAAKPKLTSGAKAYKKSVSLLANLGLSESETQAMLARLRQAPGTMEHKKE